MCSPATATAVWPSLLGQIRPLRTAIDAWLAMLQMVAAYEQIDEPPTAC